MSNFDFRYLSDVTCETMPSVSFFKSKTTSFSYTELSSYLKITPCWSLSWPHEDKVLNRPHVILRVSDNQYVFSHLANVSASNRSGSSSINWHGRWNVSHAPGMYFTCPCGETAHTKHLERRGSFKRDLEANWTNVLLVQSDFSLSVEPVGNSATLSTGSF